MGGVWAHTYARWDFSSLLSDVHGACFCAENTASTLRRCRTGDPHLDAHMSSIIASSGPESMAENDRHITQGYMLISNEHLFPLGTREHSG